MHWWLDPWWFSLPSCPHRCVFMRLTSIGVLLFSLWSQITTCKQEPCICGYNHLLYSVRPFPASNYNVCWSFVMINFSHSSVLIKWISNEICSWLFLEVSFTVCLFLPTVLGDPRGPGDVQTHHLWLHCNCCRHHLCRISQKVRFHHVSSQPLLLSYRVSLQWWLHLILQHVNKYVDIFMYSPSVGLNYQQYVRQNPVCMAILTRGSVFGNRARPYCFCQISPHQVWHYVSFNNVFHASKQRALVNLGCRRSF